MIMLVDVLEPLVPTVVHLLSESFRQNQSDGRGILAYLVRVLPLLNREARDLWRKENDAPLLLTLCDYLFSTGHRGRYLDGVLPSTNEDEHWTLPFDAHTVRVRSVLSVESIHTMRAQNAKRLCEEPRAPPNTEETASSGFMLTIAQMHHSFKLHPSYARHFGTCQRVGCTRPALLTPPETESEADDEPSEAEYWKCCRDGRAPPPTSSLPSDMSFCCQGCYKATNSEFKRLVKFNIDTPACDTRRNAAPTPSRLYRAAVKRNLAIARGLRAQGQVETKHYPRTMANRDTMLREQTTMLSVDLGVLYAASIVHELPERLRPNRTLPRTDDWRKQATCYLSAICRVRVIYMKYGRGELARGGTELWLKRLRDHALEIF